MYSDRLKRYLRTGEDLDALTHERWNALHIDEKQIEMQRRSAVLARGKAFSVQPFPDRFARQRSGECFVQSLLLSINADIIYVEGYALLPSDPNVALHHAWCEDEMGIADCTWSNQGHAYFGIPFSSDDANRHFNDRRGSWAIKDYALLDDQWLRDF